MKKQICNNCGRTLKLFEKGYIFEGRVVCGRCIKILAPGGPKQGPDYARVAVGTVGRVLEQASKTRKANEDIRYDRAKRRVIFFLNGCITIFWVIIILHVIVLVVFLITMIGA